MARAVTAPGRRRKTDPIEQAIERALAPGQYISWRNVGDLTGDLEAVEKQIAPLLSTQPERAAALYETCLAGCYAKVEEVDDEGGELGYFVRTLFCGWVRARQAIGADADETTRLLLGWMENDQYCLSSGLEEDLVKALDKPGLSAFERGVRETLGQGPSTDRNVEYRRQRWGSVLRVLLVARRDVTGYVALCEETRTTPKDCLAIARLLQARRKLAEALSWVERGLEMDRRQPECAESELRDLQRKLLSKTGRGDVALQTAWAEFADHPWKFAYDELMRYVPKADRAKWHAKAVDAAAVASLDDMISFMVEVGEIERLVERLRKTSDADLEELSHYVTEPAAKKLAPKHPEIAARVYRAMGLRIVKAGKSKYYAAALSNFREARRCWEKAGLDAQWQSLVDEIFADHRRKSSFIGGFERLARGGARDVEPSFLDRARARWNGSGKG